MHWGLSQGFKTNGPVYTPLIGFKRASGEAVSASTIVVVVTPAPH